MSVISKKMMMAAAGAGGETYWIAELNNGQTRNNFRSVAEDSSGDFCFAGESDTSSFYPNGVVVKLSKSGDLVDNVSYGQVTNAYNTSDQFYGVVCDGTDVIAVGPSVGDRAGNSRPTVVKFNSDLDVVWNKNADENQTTEFVGIDSSGNIYCGQRGNRSFESFSLSTTGNLNWSERKGSNEGTPDYTIAGGTASPTGDVYSCGQYEDGGATRYGMLLKYNSSGTFQWVAAIDSGNSNTIFQDAVVDASGNIVVVSNDMIVVKYDSSGNIVWSRSITASGAPELRAVSTDSSGNILAVGLLKGAGDNGYLVKLDSSGSLLWARTISSSDKNPLNGVIFDSNDDIVVCGTTNDNHNFFAARLPSDGSGTGTYGAFTYAVYSSTITVSSFPTFAVPFDTVSSFGLEDSGTVPTAVSTFTVTFEEITP